MSLATMDIPKGFEVRLRIIHAMVELSGEGTLKTATVGEICDRAGISRNTFYRYFAGKSEAVAWYFDFLCEQTLSQIGRTLTWQEGLTLLYQNLAQDIVFFAEQQDADAMDSPQKMGARMTYDHWRETLLSYQDVELNTRIMYQLEQWSAMALGLGINAIKRMREGSTPEEQGELVASCVPQDLRELMDSMVRKNSQQ